MKRISLTESAHNCIREHLLTGDVAIDATLGNGYDTVFLAELVGPVGHVYGFDVQETALEITSQRLQLQNLQNKVTLYQTSHANMRDWIPTKLLGGIKAIMFNLGYLPGADKSIMTQSESTLQALSLACEFLSEQGVMTVLAYPGHVGGDLETRSVEQWLSRLDADRYCVEAIFSHQNQASSPRLFVIRKQA
jgi:hypothetical protein